VQENLKLLLFALGVILATCLMLSWGKTYWKKRMTLWAASRGFVLIDFRGAAFFEGPGAFTRTGNQTTFRVKVRDRRGKVLQGWLVFGKNLNPFSAPDELVQEKWD
jgi:hypothetical protein